MPSIEAQGCRVRVAPSPTGALHIGTARTALYNWLFARQHDGKLILRIEDTDQSRSRQEYEKSILEGLEWLGIQWDEGPFLKKDGTISTRGDFGPYHQSKRGEVYQKYLAKLLEEKKAYVCYCTTEELEAERQALLSQGLPPKYQGHCRTLTTAPQGKQPQVIRFKVPEKELVIKDLIRGTVKFHTKNLGDFVIAKYPSSVLYNFAVVVDDWEMRVTHVIRGEDHLSNTPKQILLQEALGFTRPAYAHLPLILAPDRSKLSKRRAAVSVLEYQKNGYLPTAMLNFLALLGWHPKEEKEFFTPQELIAQFDLKRVQKSGAIFNEEKLQWLNAQHIKRMPTSELADYLLQFFKPLAEKFLAKGRDFLLKVLDVEKPRLKNLRDFPGLVDFFFVLPEYNADLLLWQQQSPQDAKEVLSKLCTSLEILQKATTPPTRENLLAAFNPLIAEKGRGNVLWPLRVALSGKAASPDPIEIIEVLGYEESLKRIRAALAKLSTTLPL
ncbi:glutamate--tRNA ligase [Candidatus Parcubacteria bacterium]|nr:MAG: glutamate--tRNA ligase [Candidatus Parcubacteria bacterium]